MKRTRDGTSAAAVDENHHASKRTKPDHPIAHPPGRPRRPYSTRVVPWAERLTFPSRFHLPLNEWPAEGVIDERVVHVTGRNHKRRKETQYLVAWEKVPTTGEEYEPTWTKAKDVGPHWRELWEQRKDAERTRTAPDHPSAPNGQDPLTDGRDQRPRIRAIRTIPESQSQSTAETLPPPSTKDSFSPHDLPSAVSLSSIQSEASLLSASSAGFPHSHPRSAVFEIAESQQSTTAPASDNAAIYIPIPRTGINKAEFESITSSQANSEFFRPASTDFSPSSSLSQHLVPASLSARRPAPLREDPSRSPPLRPLASPRAARLPNLTSSPLNSSSIRSSRGLISSTPDTRGYADDERISSTPLFVDDSEILHTTARPISSDIIRSESDPHVSPEVVTSKSSRQRSHRESALNALAPTDSQLVVEHKPEQSPIEASQPAKSRTNGSKFLYQSIEAESPSESVPQSGQSVQLGQPVASQTALRLTIGEEEDRIVPATFKNGRLQIPAGLAQSAPRARTRNNIGKHTTSAASSPSHTSPQRYSLRRPTESPRTPKERNPASPVWAFQTQAARQKSPHQSPSPATERTPTTRRGSFRQSTSPIFVNEVSPLSAKTMADSPLRSVEDRARSASTAPSARERLQAARAQIRAESERAGAAIFSRSRTPQQSLVGSQSMPPNGQPAQVVHQSNQSNQSMSLNSMMSIHINRVFSPRRESPVDLAIEPNISPPTVSYDIALEGSAMPVQNSIEEEPQSSIDDSMLSRTSSNQESVANEADFSQIEGPMAPTSPILGPDEYAVPLPAEGKVQSTYIDTFKAKRNKVLKFVHRQGAIGSASSSPRRTHERNEMMELVQRLHDTTTHLDLGLPGFGSQYSIQSQHHAVYAEYSGSKFAFLGHLVDTLKTVDSSIIIMSKPGQVQELLDMYLHLKHVKVKRHDASAHSQTPERPTTDFQIHLVSTSSTVAPVFHRLPALMVAFDTTFDPQDALVKRIRSNFSANSNGRLMPVVHLLVTNSSEHVDLCLSKSMPSPYRLKLLVRTAYQARLHLGEPRELDPSALDVPENRQITNLDAQRAVRKTVDRSLRQKAHKVAKATISDDFDANWKVQEMPVLELDDLEDPPIKASGLTTEADTPREGIPRSRTPMSRAATPSGKKRLLDVESLIPALYKRQRLTPMRDTPQPSASGHEHNQVEQLSEVLVKIQAELEKEKAARSAAEQDRDRFRTQLEQLRSDHAGLCRRYEKRMRKSHEVDRANKKLQAMTDNTKSRYEKVQEDNATLRERITSLQSDLNTARDDLKSAGGDIAALEVAREEARTAQSKATHLEKSLENTRKDFEFTRNQYQVASNRGAELASQIRDLEAQVESLSKEASGEKRRLKEMNAQSALAQHASKIEELELEKRNLEVVMRKLEDENKTLKRNRGIQTRGSSVQPPGSPIVAEGRRSRQNSPNPGLLSVHGSSAQRGSLLRHEGGRHSRNTSGEKEQS